MVAIRRSRKTRLTSSVRGSNDAPARPRALKRSSSSLAGVPTLKRRTRLAPYSLQAGAAQPLVSQVQARGEVVHASVPGPWPSESQVSLGMSGRGQVTVLATEEEERAPVAGLRVLDLADVDDVVAALDRVDDPALDVAERALENRRAQPAEPEIQARELVPARGREAPRDRLLVVGEDVEHEGLRVEDVRVGLGLAVDADQEERGRERERGDRVGREPVGLPAL